MMLWHMHSNVLQGFYASEVYVIASTKEEAIQRALVAYDAWLKEQVDDYCFDPLTSAFPGEPDYPADAAAVRAKFAAELHVSLEACPENAIIFRKT